MHTVSASLPSAYENTKQLSILISACFQLSPATDLGRDSEFRDRRNDGEIGAHADSKAVSSSHKLDTVVKDSCEPPLNELKDVKRDSRILPVRQIDRVNIIHLSELS